MPNISSSHTSKTPAKLSKHKSKKQSFSKTSRHKKKATIPEKKKKIKYLKKKESLMLENYNENMAVLSPDFLKLSNYELNKIHCKIISKSSKQNKVKQSHLVKYKKNHSKIKNMESIKEKVNVKEHASIKSFQSALKEIDQQKTEKNKCLTKNNEYSENPNITTESLIQKIDENIYRIDKMPQSTKDSEKSSAPLTKPIGRHRDYSKTKETKLSGNRIDNKDFSSVILNNANTDNKARCYFGVKEIVTEKVAKETEPSILINNEYLEKFSAQKIDDKCTKIVSSKPKKKKKSKIKEIDKILLNTNENKEQILEKKYSKNENISKLSFRTLKKENISSAPINTNVLSVKVNDNLHINSQTSQLIKQNKKKHKSSEKKLIVKKHASIAQSDEKAEAVLKNKLHKVNERYDIENGLLKRKKRKNHFFHIAETDKLIKELPNKNIQHEAIVNTLKDSDFWKNHSKDVKKKRKCKSNSSKECKIKYDTKAAKNKSKKHEFSTKSIIHKKNKFDEHNKKYENDKSNGQSERNMVFFKMKPRKRVHYHSSKSSHNKKEKHFKNLNTSELDKQTNKKRKYRESISESKLIENNSDQIKNLSKDTIAVTNDKPFIKQSSILKKKRHYSSSELFSSDKIIRTVHSHVDGQLTLGIKNDSNQISDQKTPSKIKNKDEVLQKFKPYSYDNISRKRHKLLNNEKKKNRTDRNKINIETKKKDVSRNNNLHQYSHENYEDDKVKKRISNKTNNGYNSNDGEKSSLSEIIKNDFKQSEITNDFDIQIKKSEDFPISTRQSDVKKVKDFLLLKNYDIVKDDVIDLGLDIIGLCLNCNKISELEVKNKKSSIINDTSKIDSLPCNKIETTPIKLNKQKKIEQYSEINEKQFFNNESKLGSDDKNIQINTSENHIPISILSNLESCLKRIVHERSEIFLIKSSETNDSSSLSDKQSIVLTNIKQSLIQKILFLIKSHNVLKNEKLTSGNKKHKTHYNVKDCLKNDVPLSIQSKLLIKSMENFQYLEKLPSNAESNKKQSSSPFVNSCSEVYLSPKSKAIEISSSASCSSDSDISIDLLKNLKSLREQESSDFPLSEMKDGNNLNSIGDEQSEKVILCHNISTRSGKNSETNSQVVPEKENCDWKFLSSQDLFLTQKPRTLSNEALLSLDNSCEQKLYQPFSCIDLEDPVGNKIYDNHLNTDDEKEFNHSKKFHSFILNKTKNESIINKSKYEESIYYDVNTISSTSHSVSREVINLRNCSSIPPQSVHDFDNLLQETASKSDRSSNKLISSQEIQQKLVELECVKSQFSMQRFKCPDNFEPCYSKLNKNAIHAEDGILESKQIWLIRAPSSFDMSKLKSLPLNLNLEDLPLKTEDGFKYQSVARYLDTEEAKALLTLFRNHDGNKLQNVKPILGEVSIRKVVDLPNLENSVNNANIPPSFIQQANYITEVGNTEHHTTKHKKSKKKKKSNELPEEINILEEPLLDISEERCSSYKRKHKKKSHCEPSEFPPSNKKIKLAVTELSENKHKKKKKKSKD